MNTTPQTPELREWLSALADGELAPSELARCLQAAEADREARADWNAYHVAGAVLRGESLGGGSTAAFVSALSARIAAEQATLPVFAESVQPLPDALDEPAANDDSAFRWKLVAGVASLAAVVAVGWSVATPLLDRGTGAQLASAPTPAAVQLANGETQRMIRDPRLDELLAAHKQAGSATALQMPAGFLRNATFDEVDR